MDLPDSIDSLTAPWLSDALGLPPRAIEGIRVRDAGDTPISHTAIVGIEYAADPGPLPASVFVKLSKESTRKNMPGYGEKEVRFYDSVAPRIAGGLVPTCYYSAFDGESKAYAIVLENLSESHYQTEYPLPPPLKDCERAMDCIAAVHAAWWDDPGLQEATNAFETRESIWHYVSYLRGISAQFLVSMGDRFEPARARIVEKALDRMEGLYERYLSHSNVTLTHSDAHLWNFLFPKRGGDRVKMIDWQSYDNGLGAYDLAYMMALHWFPARRGRYERGLLERYHAALRRNGVSNYGFDDLLYDYRISIVQLLFTPIYQSVVKLQAGIWYNHIERIFSAFDDMDCEAILR